jgi:hypothetical protein
MKTNTKTSIVLLPITLLIMTAIHEKAQTTNSGGGVPVPYALPPAGGFPDIVPEPPAPPTTAPLVVTAGTWTPLVHPAPGTIHLMLLLSDGTVMAAGGSGAGNAWYKLTPDANGSYANGTWTTRVAMLDTRLWFSSRVLTDGRVFVAGGEYPQDPPNHNFGRATAEIYDPVANSWTRIDPPTSLLDPSLPSAVNPAYNQAFADSIGEILSNGRVLVSPVLPKVHGGTLIYDPATNAWSAGPLLANNVAYQDEASWVKLPDDSILTIDPFGTHSERYIPSTNTWISDSTVPVSVYDPFGEEMGAGFLLPSGKALFLGSTGQTAIYTPSGSTSPGTWVAGPDIPNSQGTPDAGAAMMVNGKILCAVSPLATSGNHFPSPTSFYEYDYSTNSFTQVTGPTGLTENHPSYESLMLDLPDGSVLYTKFGSQLYVYRPDGNPLAVGKPAITGISSNGDGSYHLTGTLLNGISEGAAYGDDAQMASNYPIVRLTAFNLTVYYARTYNWSSTGIMTGNTPVSTEFTLPSGLPIGMYSLVAVANGIASDPILLNTGATPTPIPTPIPTPTPTPAPTPTPLPISISGAMSYCSNPVPGPVPDVTLTLTGTVSGSTLSDGSGNYTFTSLPSGGSYTVTPAKGALAPGSAGINTIDVIATQRHFLNIGTPLSGCRLAAADVNGDTAVNTVDVIAIQRFFLTQSTGIANVGKYKFSPANRTYPAVGTDQTAQNYDTLIFGDVAAGFADRAGGPSQDAAGDGTGGSEVPSTVATVALPEVAVDRSRTNFIAAVKTTAIDAKNKLVGFQGDFTFDERVVTFQSQPVSKAGITGGNWNVSANILAGGGPIRTLRISAYSNDFRPLSGPGILFNLNMTRVSKSAQGTALNWAAPPNQFIFIDADLNTQKAGNAVAGSVGVLNR